MSLAHERGRVVMGSETQFCYAGKAENQPEESLGPSVMVRHLGVPRKRGSKADRWVAAVRFPACTPLKRHIVA